MTRARTIVTSATIRHLRNAPITEAIVDFRVEARDGVSSEDFRAVQNSLSTDFPVVETRHELETIVEWNVRQEPTAPQTRDKGVTGIFLRRPDQSEVVQFRLNGFTLNRLRPYTSWASVREDALSLWQRYVDAARPKSVVRLALRYINHIPLPVGIVDIDDVLRLKLDLPPEIPQTVLGFLTRVTIADHTTRSMVNLTQSLEAGLEPGQRTLILDIDAYQNGNWEPDSDDIEGVLEVLHELKNQVFFASLTEATLERFE